MRHMRAYLAGRGCSKVLAEPLDEGMAESFMKTLKAEQINGKAFADLADARRHINSFIAEVYNRASEHPSVYVVEEKRLC
jgi:Integrase core domain